MRTVTVTFEGPQREALNQIAAWSGTTLETVAAVLLGCAMFMGRQAERASANEALAALNAKLARCRDVMEANDPGNAREIFGPPATPAAAEGAATMP